MKSKVGDKTPTTKQLQQEILIMQAQLLSLKLDVESMKRDSTILVGCTSFPLKDLIKKLVEFLKLDVLHTPKQEREIVIKKRKPFSLF